MLTNTSVDPTCSQVNAALLGREYAMDCLGSRGVSWIDRLNVDNSKICISLSNGVSYYS